MPADTTMELPTFAPTAHLLGKTVHVAFDGRGLATVTDHEDGMCEVTWLDDAHRTSENVRSGETEWLGVADLKEVS